MTLLVSTNISSVHKRDYSAYCLGAVKLSNLEDLDWMGKKNRSTLWLFTLTHSAVFLSVTKHQLRITMATG